MSDNPEYPEYPEYAECDSCFLKFENKFELEKHEANSHAFSSLFGFLESTQNTECDADDERNIKRFACSACTHTSYYKYNVEKHLKIHKDIPAKVRKIGCSLCESQQDHQVCNIFRKLDKKKLTKQFQCEQCHFSTISKDYLESHIDNVHRKILRFFCNVCDYKSYYRNYVKEHLKKVHEIEKDYKHFVGNISGMGKDPTINKPRTTNEYSRIKSLYCSLCGHASYSKGNLRKHIDNKHRNTDAKVLKIGCSKCDLQEQHKLCDSDGNQDVKFKKKLFTCEDCDYSSDSKQTLKEHTEKVHNGVIRYRCSLCDYKHYYKHYVTRHQVKSHQNEEPEIVQTQSISSIDIIDKIDKRKDSERLHSPKFRCNICEKESYHRFTIRKHQNKEHKDEKTKVLKIGCIDCEENTENHNHTFTKYPRHQVKTHQNENQSDYVDKKKYPTRLSIPRFSCNLCDKKSYKSITIKKHQNKEHKDETTKVLKIGCLKCQENYKNHSHTKENQIIFYHWYCNLCDKKSYNSQIIRKHQNKEHKGENTKLLKIGCVKCQENDENHRHLTKSLYLWSCNLCDKKSYQSWAIRKHQSEEHLGKESKVLKIGCIDCEENVENHNHSVKITFRFSCNLCDKKSHNSYAVRKHQNKEHKDEKTKVLKIGCIDCEENTENHNHTLTKNPRHQVKTHQSENQSDDVDKKNDPIRLIPRFSCNLCDKKSYKSQTIRKHQNKEHKDENTKVLKIGCVKCQENDENHRHTKKSFLVRNPCFVCNIEFNSNRKRVLHYEKEHPSERIFKCNICDYDSNVLRNLQAHEKRHEKNSNIPRDVESNEKRHDISAEKTKNDSFVIRNPCFICHLEFSSNDNRVSHYEEEHPSEWIFRCTQCAYGSNVLKNLRAHEKRHEKNSNILRNVESTIPCFICHLKFSSNVKRVSHYKKEHPSERIFKCNHCDYGSNVLQNLQVHEKRHEKVKLSKIIKKTNYIEVECKECDKKFISNNERRLHYKNEHPDKRIFQCESCDYSSNYLANIKTHSNSTHSKKILQCHICDYSSTWNSSFLQHMREKHELHQRRRSKKEDQSESLICEECGFKANTMDNLNNHLRSHFKTYKCYECEEVFKNRGTRLIHRRLEHLNYRYNCSECSFSTRYYPHLLRHRKKHTI